MSITLERFLRGTVYVLAFAALVALINYLSSVLLPFFMAWGVAYLIYPMVLFFQHKCRLRNRTISIVVTLAILVLIISLILALIVPSMVAECVRLKELIVSYLARVGQNKSVPAMIEDLVMPFLRQYDWATALQNGDLINVVRQIAPGVGSVFSQAYQLVGSLFTFLASLLYLFFILLDYEQLTRGWQKLLPTQQRTSAQQMTRRVRSNMGSYFRGQSLVALCVGILFSIGFSIIDFPMAIGLGIFIGLLNLVPYLQLVGFIPAIILSLLKAYDTGESFWLILLSALAVFAIVQLIQDMLLTPKIMGKAMGLNPAMMLLSLSVWGAVLGFIGLIIALPLTNLIMAYVNEWLDERDNNVTNT